MGARLKSHRGGKFDLGQNAEINVTPFVDVMLVLLIIFMVAAPLPTVAIKVEIPPTPQTPPDHPKPPVFVNVQKGGRLYIANEPTSRRTLLADLAAALRSDHPTAERIMLRADRDVPYRELMAVMNDLHVGGFYKIGLIAEDL